MAPNLTSDRSRKGGTDGVIFDASAASMLRGRLRNSRVREQRQEFQGALPLEIFWSLSA